MPAQARIVLIKVLKGKLSKAEAARKLNISRKTLYKWIDRLVVQEGEKSKLTHRKRISSKNTYKKEVLSHAAANPQFGPKRISAELKKLDKYISQRSVWLVLKEHNLQTQKSRHEFSSRFNISKKPKAHVRQLRHTPETRKRLVEEVLLSGRKVSDISREYHISRKTYLKWKKRYQTASAETRHLLHAMFDQHPTGSSHPRGASEHTIQAVLSLVAQEPSLSCHKLADRLSIIGNHGVQNILSRNSLNLLSSRLDFAGRQPSQAPLLTPTFGRIRSVFESFLPSRAPAPPPAFRPFFKYLLSSFALSLFISLGTINWISILGNAYSPSHAIGLVFASIALAFGSFFFVYSLKYYLTLAIVLSFSQEEGQERVTKNSGKDLLSWILGLGGRNGKHGFERKAIGLESSLDYVKLKGHPFVSIHIPFYNEKNVVRRSIEATTNFDYKGEYEVILCDDSTDQTTDIIRDYQKEHLRRGESLKVIKGDGWTLASVEVKPGVTLKHLHRTTRSGFKGGALKIALTLVDPRTEFISIFDADFVPYPDTLGLFLKYFQATAGTLDFTRNSPSLKPSALSSRIAAVQGYQWHVLNKSENWITRGVRCEYAGSYVIERSGQEIYGGLKHISGSVYMIRRDVLEEVGWETSITEDYELTLKLYDAGYKVVFTPYIQAPAECVSTIKRLIRQRMRWSEGHSHNVRKMFFRLLTNPKLTLSEKLEFLYNAPYYLQAFFFIVGTLAWLISETVFPARLPFWTVLWGWSLVLTNMFALPLMNAVGLFLEESEERDYLGIASFVALSYVVVPFQAYASLKGFLEKEEGGWFRTPKSGRITDVFTRGAFYRLVAGILPGRSHPSPALSHEPSALSQYLALASANNTFSSFAIKARNRRWLGRALTSILLLISTTLVSLAPYVGIAGDVDAERPGSGVLLSPEGVRSFIPSLVKSAEANTTPFDIERNIDTSFELKTSGIKISGEKTDFTAHETPSFTIGKNQGLISSLTSKLNSLVNSESSLASGLTATIIDVDGRRFTFDNLTEEDGNINVNVPKKDDFKPGEYSLLVQKGDSGLLQDFTWGVLAVNTTKSIYREGEIADLAIAVLDERGDMVCDAEVSLTITAPGKETPQLLSTGNGRIVVNPQCRWHQITRVPDYQAQYVIGGEGTYEMVLTATTQNGSHTIADTFEVKNNPDFDISRHTGTRIYPLAEYPVIFTIKANKDYRGYVEEKVPSGFRVKATDEYDLERFFEIKADLDETFQEPFTLEPQGDNQVLRWYVDWQEGETYELAYKFDAPEVSPEFFLLGPLWIGGFTEARSWQLAIDAVPSGIIVAWDGTAASIPTGDGWTRVTGLDTYFLEGTTSDPSGTAGGAATHTHTSPTHTHSVPSHTHTKNSNTYTGGSTAASGTSPSPTLAGDGHIHSYTSGAMTGISQNDSASASLGTYSNDPPYTKVIWIQSDGTTDIPVNAWAFNKSDSLPSGWSRVAGNTFLKGADASGDGGATDTANQSDAHWHTDTGHTHTEQAHSHSAGSVGNANGGVDGKTNSTGYSVNAHTHTVSSTSSDAATEQSDSTATTGTADAQPPYYKMNIVDNGNVSADTPTGVVAVWTGTIASLPSTWGVCNGVDTTYCPNLNDKFIKGANADSESGITTDGNTSHSHGNGNTHTHTINTHPHTVTLNTEGGNGYVNFKTGATAVTPSHYHTVPLSGDGSGTTGTATISADTSSTETRPPYKEAVFVYKKSVVNITGSCKQRDQGSNCPDDQTVKVAVNADVQAQTGTTGTGSFTISSVVAPNAGDVITIWIDGVDDAHEAVAVTKYDGSGNIEGILLYEEHLTLGSSDTSVTITNDDLDTYDYSVSSNEDIFFDVDVNNDLDTNATSQAISDKLYIKADVTYRPDSASSGNVTTHDIQIVGTLTADNNTFNIEGSWDNDSVFTAGESSVIFKATSGTESITSSGATTHAFYNLTLGQTSGTAEWDLGSALDVDNDLAVTYGTLDMNGSNNITLGGGLTIGANGNYTPGTGSFTFDGAATPVTWTDNYGANLGTVIINGTSKTVNLGTAVVMNSLEVGADDTFAMSTYDVQIGSTAASGSGDITIASGGTTSQSASGTVTIISSASGTADLAGPGTFTCYNLTLGNGATTFTIDAESSDLALDVANDLTITANATFSASTTAGFQVGANFDNNGTFTSNQGTVTMDSQTTGKTVSAGSDSFYNLTFNDGGNSGAWSFVEANITVTNDFTITGGSVTAPSGNLTISGDFINADTFTHNSGTVVFVDASQVSRILNPAAGTAFYNLTVNTRNKSIQFDNADGTTVDSGGTLSIQGPSCEGLIGLSSDSGGSQWELTTSGATVDIDYAVVTDGAAQNATTADNSENGGNNNVSWTINTGSCEGFSTSSLATAYSFQRKTIYSTTYSKYWIFYHDGSEIEIRYSADGASWTPAAALAYDTHDFSVWYKDISGTEYVFLAVASGGDILVKRGTIEETNISWHATTQTALGTDDANTYQYPFVALDSVTNNVWVSAQYYNGADYFIHTTKTADTYSATSDWSTDSSTLWDAYTQLATAASTSNTYATLAPMDSDHVYSAFALDTTLYGCEYDATTDFQWEDSNNDACGGGSGGAYYFNAAETDYLEGTDTAPKQSAGTTLGSSTQTKTVDSTNTTLYILTDNVNKKWTNDKSATINTAGEKRNIDIATDSSGNTVSVWEDDRNSQTSGTWSSGGNMNSPRHAHTLTLLQDGRVLAAGGQNMSTYLSSSEIYDPITSNWTASGNMTSARSYHTATLLNNGKVLVTGGTYAAASYRLSSELFDPRTGTWSASGNMSVTRTEHKAILLNSGKVLVFGDVLSSSAELYDPASGTFTVTSNNLSQYRYRASATLLPNGKVLTVGGWGSGTRLSTAELYDPVTNSWKLTAGMNAKRESPIVILLTNGRVLVSGGFDVTGTTYHSTAEIYDPSNETWTLTGSMNAKRSRHAGILLNNGKVLTAAGAPADNTTQSSSELYDPASGKWTSSGNMETKRDNFAVNLPSVLLNNGKVLVSGGYNVSVSLSTAELYTPVTYDIYAQKYDKDGTILWGSGSDIKVNSDDGSRDTNGVSNYDHLNPKVKLDSSGNAIITWQEARNSVFGDDIYAQKLQSSDGAKLWPSSTTDSFVSTTGGLVGVRYRHTATPLTNGKVLVAGGYIGSALTTSELYDPSTGTWSATTGGLVGARYAHTATLLTNGKVLVAGGYDSSALTTSELYDPSTGRWSATTGGLAGGGSAGHTATLLANGKVLVAGGLDSIALTTSELYDPSTGRWSATTGGLAGARYYHTATLLANGKVLVAGGLSSGSGLTTSELYDPSTGRWSATTGGLVGGRYQHTATLLTNGKVLVAGGTSGSALTTSELYDPSTGRWSATTGGLVGARYYHTSTLLENGKVLVAGGLSGSAISTAELYTPAADIRVSSDGSPMNGSGLPNPEYPDRKGILGEQRKPILGIDSSNNAVIAWEDNRFSAIRNWGLSFSYDANAWYQTNNTFQAYGACNGGATNSSCGAIPAIEGDPVRIMAQKLTSSSGAKNWGDDLDAVNKNNPEDIILSATGDTNMNPSLAIDGTDVILTWESNSALKAENNVLKRESNIYTQKYDTNSSSQWGNSFTSTTGGLDGARYSHSSTLLSSGKILIAGGLNSIALTTAGIFDPSNNSYTATSGGLVGGRFSHSSVHLNNGKVLIIGGTNGMSLTTAELYDPSTNRFTSTTGGLNVARTELSATLFSNGKVLVAAGSSSTTAELYDPATDRFTATTGGMVGARYYQTTTLLGNGKVLLIGGFNSSTLTTAELYDPSSDRFTATTGGLIGARYYHTATLLNNGKVLVVGGWNGSTKYTTAELYDPSSDRFTATTGGLAEARYSQTATIIGNNKVLIAGGSGSSILTTAELYDPSSDRFTATTGGLIGARYFHNATNLNNGKVLVTGGSTGSALSTAELYSLDQLVNSAVDLADQTNPAIAINGSGTGAELYYAWQGIRGSGMGGGGTNGDSDRGGGKWSIYGQEYTNPASASPSTQWPSGTTDVFTATTGGLAGARYSHTATLLTNGKVLVTGGYLGVSALTTSELYDPSTGRWSSTTGGLVGGRYWHTATLLTNGKVLLVGGIDSAAVTTAELYDPATNRFTATTGGLVGGRSNHTATLLGNGKVLLTGGNNGSAITTAELYDPATNRFTATTGGLAEAKRYHTATLLGSGKVLVLGGSAITTAELYDPTTDRFVLTSGGLTNPRQSHTSTLLANGKILVTGGTNGSGTYYSTAELYNPSTNRFTLTTGGMSDEKIRHTATLLGNGKVLVTGGYNFDGASNYLSLSELYDPSTDRFTTTTGILTGQRDKHTVTLLVSGKVIVVGGAEDSTTSITTAELYNPAGEMLLSHDFGLAGNQTNPVLTANSGNPIVAWTDDRSFIGNSVTTDKNVFMQKISGSDGTPQWPSATSDYTVMDIRVDSYRDGTGTHYSGKPVIGGVTAALDDSSERVTFAFEDARTGTGDSWYSSLWSYRKKITIVDDASLSGSSDFTDFPVLVSLSSDTDLSSRAQADGDDIIFTDQYGTKLNHEIEKYSSGTLEAWVRVPTVSNSQDTVLYMYYGNSSVGAQEYPEGVWDDNYMLVQHLQETTTGNTDFLDSTKNNNDSFDVTIDGAGSNPDATGQVDGAVQFDGSDDEVELIDADNQTPTGDLTLEAWVKFDTLASTLGHNQNVLFKGGGATFSYYITLTSSDNFARFHWRNSSADGYSVDFNNYALSTGEWYYITGKYESGTTYVFVNGTKEGDTNTPTGTLFNGNIGLQIGSTDGFDQTDGTVDEVRLSNVARTDGWVITTYNNLNAPSDFYNIGNEESENSSAFDCGTYNSGGEVRSCLQSYDVLGQTISQSEDWNVYFYANQASTVDVNVGITEWDGTQKVGTSADQQWSSCSPACPSMQTLTFDSGGTYPPPSDDVANLTMRRLSVRFTHNTGSGVTISYDNSGYDSRLEAGGGGGGGSADTIATISSGMTNTHSLVVNGTNDYAHIIYTDASGNIIYDQYDGDWDFSEATISDTATGNAYPTLSLDTATDDLWAIWVRDDDIFYEKATRSDATWSWTGTATTWKNEGVNTYPTSNYSGESRIYVLWTIGETSPYSIGFDTIIIPENLWLAMLFAPFIPLLAKRRKRKLNPLYQIIPGNDKEHKWYTMQDRAGPA